MTGTTLLAVLHRKAAAGQEAVLHVDHKQRGAVVGLDRSRPETPGNQGRKRQRAEACNYLSSIQHRAPPRFDIAGGG
ncbi:hypothetical protein ACVIHD_005587 [Bradyrhizobium embrapense]